MFECGSFSNNANRVYWIPKKSLGGDVPEVLPREVRVRLFEGLMDGVVESPNSGEEMLGDILERTGEWFALAEKVDGSKRFYFAVADFHCFQRLFAAGVSLAGEDYWILGQDFDSIAALKSRLHTAEIDWDIVLPTLTSNHNFMTGTWSTRTWSNGIQELFPGQVWGFSSKEIKVYDRPFFRPGADGSYHDFVSKGIEKACAEIDKSIRSSATKPILYLSGGRDSRMNLAFVLASGLADKVEFQSEHPSKFPEGYSRKVVANDYRIANMIAERFGLTRRRLQARWGKSLTYADAFDAYQRVYSGSSFEFHPQKFFAREFEDRTEIRGAGGELLRSAYSGYHRLGWWRRSVKNESKYLDSDAKVLFGAAVRAHLLGAEQRERSKAAFVNSLSIFVDAPIAEQLSAHYAIHRNRAHFGAKRDKAAKGILVVDPLCQPEFLYAAQSLDYRERLSGVLAYDVVETLMPELNRIPFDNAPGWPNSVYASRGKSPLTEEELEIDFPIERYKKLTDDYRYDLAKAAISNKPAFSDGVELSKNYARAALFDVCDESGGAITEKYRDTLWNYLKNNRLNPHQTATRLRTLMQLLGIDELPQSEHLVVKPRTIEKVGSKDYVGALSQAKRSTVGFVKPEDAFELAVTAFRAGDKIKVSIEPKGSALRVKEYAVYILIDDEIVQRKMYQADPEFSFDLEVEQADSLQMSSLVFARFRGDKEFRIQKRVKIEPGRAG